MSDDAEQRSLTRQALTANAFVELVDTLVGDFDVIDVLTGLTARCVELLGPPCTEQIKDVCDTNAHAANTRPASTLGIVNGNATQALCGHKESTPILTFPRPVLHKRACAVVR